MIQEAGDRLPAGQGKRQKEKGKRKKEKGKRKK